MNVRHSLPSIVFALLTAAAVPGAHASGASAASAPASTAPAAGAPAAGASAKSAPAANAPPAATRTDAPAELPYAEGVTPENAATAAATRELLALVGGRAMIDRTVDQLDSMLKRLPEEISKSQQLNPRQREIVDESLRKMMALYRTLLSWDTFEPMMVEIYRHTFTQAELDASMAFYRTPAGQSMVRKLPVVQQYSMQLVQQQLQEIMPQMQVLQRKLIADLEAAAAPK